MQSCGRMPRPGRCNPFIISCACCPPWATKKGACTPHNIVEIAECVDACCSLFELTKVERNCDVTMRNFDCPGSRYDGSSAQQLCICTVFCPIPHPPLTQHCRLQFDFFLFGMKVEEMQMANPVTFILILTTSHLSACCHARGSR